MLLSSIALIIKNLATLYLDNVYHLPRILPALLHAALNIILRESFLCVKCNQPKYRKILLSPAQIAPPYLPVSIAPLYFCKSYNLKTRV
jgi:hypothetical protein